MTLLTVTQCTAKGPGGGCGATSTSAAWLKCGSWHVTPPGSLSADTAAGSRVPAFWTAPPLINEWSANLGLCPGACHTPARPCDSSSSVL